MTTISAAQLVYTSVGADRSPSGRVGHQVLMRSREHIDDAEAGEIEIRLFYPANASPSPKWLFFRLQSGKYAVARIVPLPVRDTFGRSGVFFAHVLVLASAALMQIGNNPFQILRTFPFFSSLEEALARPDGTAGEIAPTPIEVPAADGSEPAPEPAAREELWPLVMTALRSRQMLEQHEALALGGSPEEAFRFLDALLSVIPVAARPECSFDTCFQGGNIIRIPYWAVGSPLSDFRSPEWIVFDLAENRFRRRPDSNPATSFEYWLRKEWDSPTPLTQIAEQAGSQFAISAWLDGAPGKTLEVDEAALREALRSDRPRLERRMASILATRLAPVLAEQVAPRAADWLVSEEGSVLQRVREDCGGAPIEEWILALVSAATDRPKASLLEALAGWIRAQVGVSPELLLRYRRWAGDWRELAQSVAALSDQQYRGFASWALSTVRFAVKPVVQPGRGIFGLALQRSAGAADDTDARNLLSAIAGASWEQGTAVSEGWFDRLLPARSRAPEEPEWLLCRLPRTHVLILIELLMAEETR